MLKTTRERLEAQGVDVKGGAVKDIHNGTVLMELGGAKSGRLAALDAGYAACLMVSVSLHPDGASPAASPSRPVSSLSTGNAPRLCSPSPTSLFRSRAV